MDNIIDQSEFDLQGISIDDVRSVYSGKQGCMCGCKGKHRYHPKHLVEATKDRGYGIGPEETNLRQVTKVLRLLQADSRTALQDGYILHIKDEKKLDDEKQYVAYLTKEGAKKIAKK
jgi:hypothetical protein